MGRGFSAHRSHSKRATNKTKRARSSSVLQTKRDEAAIKPAQNHIKRDTSVAKDTAEALQNAIANVETSTAKRRGVSEAKRAADELAASGRTRSESVQKTVYLGNRMVRTVGFTRHFSMKKKEKEDGDDAEEADEEEEVHEDFMDEAPSEDESETIRRPDVFTKYVEAGKVVDAVLSVVAAACVPGASTKDLCEMGDKEIFKRVGTLFKNVNEKAPVSDLPPPKPNGKRSLSVAMRARSSSVVSRPYGVSNFERSTSRAPTRGRSQSSNPLAVHFGTGLPRGISFPVTVSVNEILCNHTPFSADDAVILKPCDVVKIHCGVHVDGYPVSAARTIVVQPNEVAIGDDDAAAKVAAPLPATAVNAIEASRVSLAGAIHLMRPGAVNDDITDFIASVGAHYQAEAIEGVLSTRSKRWITDSVSSSIICRRVTSENPQQDVAYCEVEPYQIWSLDMAFTNSSSYKMQTPLGTRYNSHCNIYRKNEILSANPTLDDLRSKAASHLLTQEIRNKFHCFPFNPHHADDPLKCRLGLVALKKVGQIDCFDELMCKINSAYDAEGRICKKAPKNDNRAITARFSATIAVTEKRVHVLCGGVGIISDEFLSKKKSKDHKAAVKAGTKDIGGFAAECGGLASFEELYGACFPTAALGAPAAEFESEHVPLFVRTPTDQLKGLLASPLNFGKAVVSSSTSDAIDALVAGDDDEEAVMVARENMTAKRKTRRTETASDAASAAPASAIASTAAATAKMDASTKAKLVSMHPSRKTTKK